METVPPRSHIVYPIKSKPPRPFPKKALFAVGGFFMAAILFGGLLYAVRLPYFRVNQIEVAGVRLLPASEIEEAARENISGVRWRVIPRDNFFFVSGRRIADGLRQKFPQVSEISVDKKFPNRLVIKIKERILWGVYCIKPEAEPPSQSCFYLDTRGAAYEELSSYQGWLLPVIYSYDKPRLGEPAVAPSALEFFDSAKKAVAAIGGNALSMTFSSSTPDEARLGLADGWEIWVTASRPISEWLTVLKTVLEKDIGSRRNELEYIDLRFGNKVFYKYR